MDSPIPRRIEVVDALRGSALIGLFLLHCREHFEFAAISIPDQPGWLLSLNAGTKALLNFFFAGKAYAIFAMMFGLSFFIIIDRAARRGVDFRARFVWRMVVLGLIGYTFGLIFCGEILSMIMLLGLPLVLLYRLPTRWLWAISIVFLIQPQFWWQFFQTVGHPDYRPLNLNVGGYYRQLFAAFSSGRFVELLEVNAWTGVLARHAWSFGNGRYFQMFGLFVWGLLIGRYCLCEQPEKARRVAKTAFATSIVAFVVLYVARETLPGWGVTKVQIGILKRVLDSYVGLSQMIVWASGFTLLYSLATAARWLRLLIPFGRMSMSFYILHNAVGVLFFYPFALGMHARWAEFYSVLAGAVSLFFQYPLAVVWLKRFHYGPFEWWWRSLTQLSFNVPFRRTAHTAVAAPPQAALDPCRRLTPH